MTVPAHCSLPSQTSSKVQALPSSHGVLAGWKASGGQYTLVPVQVSAASQMSAAPWQTRSEERRVGKDWRSPSHASALHELRSSAHAATFAAGVPAQTPPSQVSLLVQELLSSHAAPSRSAGLPAEGPFWQVSAAVQALPSSQGVPFGWGASCGQYTLVPVQVSAASQMSAAPWQTVPALAGG